jgi:hypothetical protein
MKNKTEKLKDGLKGKSKKSKNKSEKNSAITHLGSSDAFSETENPQSRDADDISDEKLDELIGD